MRCMVLLPSWRRGCTPPPFVVLGGRADRRGAAVVIRWKPGAVPGEFEGGVTWCFDGDTCRVNSCAGQFVVRIFGCDAPECGQAFFREARWRLVRLTRGERVTVRPVTRDCYGRLVARLFLRGHREVAPILVREGLAWWDRRYARFRRDLAGEETGARAARRGVWSVRTGRWAPWVWRRRQGIGG